MTLRAELVFLLMLRSHSISDKTRSRGFVKRRGERERISSSLFSSLGRTWHIWRSGNPAGPSSRCETLTGLGAGHWGFPPWPGLYSASSAEWRLSSGEPDSTWSSGSSHHASASGSSTPGWKRRWRNSDRWQDIAQSTDFCSRLAERIGFNPPENNHQVCTGSCLLTII